jgi:cholesterol transport system auxiliary component
MNHSRLRQVVRMVGLGSVMLACSGCISLSASYPEKHLYVLDVVRLKASHAFPAQNGLKVNKLRISPAFEGRQFVYRIGDVRYEADFYHEWIRPPNTMLTQQVLNWLTAGGLFHYVVDAASTLNPTHRLEGNVTVLYGDLRDTPPKAVLGLQFFLIPENTSLAKLVWHRTYREEVNVPEKSPNELAKGWNEALRRILSDLEKDLKEIVRNP